MDDTHTSPPDVTSANRTDDETDLIESLEALDPAEAPEAAEELAARLSARLEDVGAPSPAPVQLQAEFNVGSDAGRG